MDFSKNEDLNASRWSWNVLPSSRLEQTKMVLPVGNLYTPLKNISGMPVLDYEPVVCKNCRGLLNPMCKVDFRQKVWACPLCFTKNLFPPSYNGIDENNQPAELYPQYSTLEYVLNRKLCPPPAFIFVIDTCMLNDEVEALRDCLLRSINLIPENSTVGLITYGTNVQVYELGHSECTKAYIFRGDKEPTVEQIQDQLGLKTNVQNFKLTTNTSNRPVTPQQSMNTRFLLPLSECEVVITQILEELQPDAWPLKEKTRPKRCTGVALSIATSIAEIGYASFGARILTFVGGACTVGPGQVVGVELMEQLRSHNDLRADKAPFFKKAVEFYNNVAQRLVKNGHTCDIFSANLDQCGVMEMRACCENTGGDLFVTDTFEAAVFKQTYINYFKMQGEHLAMGLNGTFDVRCSQEVKISGVIGPVTSMNKQTTYVSDNEIGYGKTSSWKINAMNPNTTLALYFDVVNQDSQVGDVSNPTRYFQYLTQYQHPSGQTRLRVTTQALKWVPQNTWNKISIGFDQEASAVLIARYSSFKAEVEHLFDVLRWLDRSLIRLIAKFSEYRKDDPNSLTIFSNFSMFPQFMYHLRRSQFLRTFNTSPDETTFFRLILNRETTQNSILMIQPTLFSYSLQEAPHPVLLDAKSLQKNNILLFDSYFHILIRYGETIAEWRDLGYQKEEKYKHFKRLLEIPKEDGKKLLKDRYPTPKFLETDEDGSDERILVSRINPSSTHISTQNQGFGQTTGKIVITDDAALEDFIQHLKKLAVEQ